MMNEGDLYPMSYSIFSTSSGSTVSETRLKQQFCSANNFRHASSPRAWVVLAAVVLLLSTLAAIPAYAQADLIVTSASASCSNSALYVDIAIRNQGVSNAGTFRVGVYVSPNNVITTSDMLIASATRTNLNAATNSSIAGTVSVPTLTTGVYYVGAIVDDLGQIAESNETNNSRSGNTLDLPCLYGSPDISISHLDVTFDESTKSLDAPEAIQAPDTESRAILLANRAIVTESNEKSAIALSAGYQIIQFDDFPPLDIADTLAAEGIEVLHYVPRNGLMIYVPDELDGIAIEEVVWAGSLLPVDKINQTATKAVAWDYALVEVFPNVARDEAIARIEAAGGHVLENDYLLPYTFLVQGDQQVALGLAELDIVNWIEPAPAPVVNGTPFHQCPGTATPYGIMPKYVVRGDGWDGPGLGAADLKYFFVNGTGDVANSDEQAQVERALAEWARYADLAFTRTTFAGQTRTIDIRWATGDHGDGTPFDGLAGVLAHAFYPAGAGVESLAGDLHFDDAETWGIAPGTGLDVFTIALHELGHTLGLNHSTDTNAVMYGLIYPTTVHAGLKPDDIAGIQTIYAAATAPDSFNVSNTGTHNLTIASIVPESSAPWLSTSPTAPFVIAPGAVLPVRVSVNYALAPAGTSVRRLLVNSNDPDESPYPDGVNVTVNAAGTESPPQIVIGAPSDTATNSGPISFPVTYANASSVTLSAAHVTLNTTGTANGTLSVSGTGTASRTITVSNITGNGYLSVSVAAGSASNGAGAAAAAGPSNTVAVDNTAPTLSISIPSPLTTTTGPITFALTYAGATSVSLAAADVNLVRVGTADATVAVSGTGTTSRTVTLNNVTGDGSLAISIAAGTASDAVGNTAAGQGPSLLCAVLTVVENPVAIALGPPSSYSTSTGPITFSVTYTNATSVTLDAADVVLQKTGSANAVVSVSGTGANERIVTLSSITGNGDLGISIQPGSASNSISTAPGIGPSNNVSVVNSTPDPVSSITVTIGPPSTYSTMSGPVSYNVTYANATTISLSPSHVTLRKSGTADGVVSVSTVSANVRRVTISSITGTGTLGIHIASGSASNTSYVAPSAGPSNNFNVANTTAPAVNLSISAPTSSATVTGPVSYTVTYTNAEAVTLSAAHVTLNRTSTANGTVSVSGSGTTTRTVTISNISGAGTLSISLAAGTASNSTSTAPAIGPSTTCTVSNLPIKVHMGPPSSYSTSNGPVNYTITYTNATSITLSPSDVTLNRTGSAEASVSVAPYGTTRRIVTLSNITGSGTLAIYVKSGTATNAAGFTAPAAGPGNAVTVQNAGGITTPITIHIGPPSTYSATTGPVSYTLTYSGAESITLGAANVVLRKSGTANGTVTVSTLSSTQRLVSVGNLTGSGTIGIWIEAGTATNSGGNSAPSAGPSNSFNVSSPGAITSRSPEEETQLLGSVLTVDPESGLTVPVSCAAVRVWRGEEVVVTAVTDFDGTFYSDGMLFGGPYNVEVVSPGYESQLLENLSVDIENQFQEIFMLPSTDIPQVWGSVAARFPHNLSAMPVGGATVSLLEDGVEIAQTITCATGLFEFGGVSALQGTVSIVTLADGFDPTEVVVQPNAPQSIDVTLAPDPDALGSVAGAIVDAETGAAIEAEIRLHEVGGSTTLSYSTNDAGQYGFSNIAPGIYSVHATSPDYTSLTDRVTVEDMAAVLDLELAPRDPQDLLARNRLATGCAGLSGASGTPTADILLLGALCAVLLVVKRRQESALRR